MKLQLNLKTQMINNLTKKLNAKAAVTANIKNEVPSAFHNAFKATANELRLKSQECDSLSEHLESIIIANTDNHEDLTHKMIKKLNYLVQENEALMEMISNSSKLTLMIELGMCKNELTVLKEKLKKYEEA
jgi:chemotaxis regulatin CheY-phosphate phosphatase CheZ